MQLILFKSRWGGEESLEGGKNNPTLQQTTFNLAKTVYDRDLRVTFH